MADGPNLTASIIAIHVSPVELGKLHSAADDAANDAVSAVGVSVLDQRRRPGEACRNLRGVGPLPGSFEIIPAKVRAASDQIDPFDRILADMTQQEFPVGRIETKPPRIAHTNRPELRAHVRGINT